MKLVRENIEFKRGDGSIHKRLGVGYQGLYDFFKEVLNKFALSEILFWQYVDSINKKDYIEFCPGISNTDPNPNSTKRIILKELKDWIYDDGRLFKFCEEDTVSEFHSKLRFNIQPEYMNLMYDFVKEYGQWILGTDTLRKEYL